jgi:hypothetical protein
MGIAGSFITGLTAGYVSGKMNQSQGGGGFEAGYENEGDYYNGHQFNVVWERGAYSLNEGYPFILSDLFSNIRAFRYSIPAYFSSLTMKILFPIMALSMGYLTYVFSQIMSGVTVGIIIVSAVLLLTAMSPVLTTFRDKGVWRLVGGKPRLSERIALIVALAPVVVLTVALFPGAEPMGKLFIALFFIMYVVAPLTVRYIGAKSIRERIHASVKVLDSNYLNDLLSQKVVGVAGASLGTSGFGQSELDAGVAGERRTAKLLDEFAYSHDNAIVFHSVRWNMDGAPYDIDHVVVIGQTVFFLDSKQWRNGHYTMVGEGDTVLRDGMEIPNGDLHIQSGADSYINAFGIDRSITQVVVWTEGTLRNQNAIGPRLVTGQEMIQWLEQSANDPTIEDGGYNVPLLRRLEEKTT